MIANLVSLLGLGLIVYLFSRRYYNWFFAISLLYLVIFPDLRLGGIYLSTSYPLMLVLLVFVLVSRSRRISRLTMFYGITLFFVLGVNVAAWLLNGRWDLVGLFSIGGRLKIGILVILLSALYYSYQKEEYFGLKRTFELFIFLLLSVNIVAMLLQLIAPEFSLSLFPNLYLTPSLTPLKSPMVAGSFHRLYGTFGSPVHLALVTLGIWAYSIAKLAFCGRKFHAVIAVLALFVGLGSLSKTFILGAVLLLVLLGLVYLFLQMKDKRWVTRYGAVLLVILLIGAVTYFFLENQGAYARYYFSFLTRPLEALSSRYSVGGDVTLLSETYRVIMSSPFLGVGPVSVTGEFVGDSLYVQLLHNGGAVAFVIFLGFSFVLVRELLARREMPKVFVYLAILIGGLSSATLFSSELIIPFLFFITNPYQTDRRADR